MGGSLMWTSTHVDKPGMVNFINAHRYEDPNNNPNRDHQNPAADQRIPQYHPSDPVFEISENIFRVLNNQVHLESAASDCLSVLSILDTYNDFSYDLSRVRLSRNQELQDQLPCQDCMEHPRKKLHLATVKMNDGQRVVWRNALMKLRRRAQGIESSCNYHLRTIERRLNNDSEGQGQGQLSLEPISASKSDYYRLHARPLLQAIKKHAQCNIIWIDVMITS